MSDQVRRRNLPHWSVPGAAYFVTTCLQGSIPAQGLLDIRDYRGELASRPTPPWKTKVQFDLDKSKMAFARVDQWLDRAPATRRLESPNIAGVVCDAIYHFAGQRYNLLAYVVMPSHFHWVFRPMPAWTSTLEEESEACGLICKSINQHSATQANLILGRSGQFWQHESHDHWIRDFEELERIIHYVEGNPVKAGLVSCPEDWLFSSAADRKRLGSPFGVPLTR